MILKDIIHADGWDMYHNQVLMFVDVELINELTIIKDMSNQFI